MAQKARYTSVRTSAAPKRPRPGQDIIARRQATQFPDVGMTLRSYQNAASERRPRASRTARPQTSRWQRLTEKLTLKRFTLVLGVLVLLIVGWVGGKFLWNAHKLFGGNILGILSSTKLKGEDDGRVNILLAGNSADDAGHNGGRLTDSIMLVSIDTRNNKAFMLSIPRDLWVKVPGDGHQKINGAYVVGEEAGFSRDGYPEGGMGALEQIISQDFDIPIHYYALINYNAMKQAVDAVGGVDFTVKSEDPRGLFDPNIDWTTRKPLVKLSNGTHHLNGQAALDLARARGDAYNSYGFAGSDFTRTENQRKLLIALKNKAISAGVLANPAKLSSLMDAIGNNVQTDFKINEVRRLYDIMKKIGNNNIQSLGLNDVNGESLLASYTSPMGQSALIPAAGVDDFSEIQAFIRQKTSSNQMVQEAAKIVVLNGTDINGLAGKTKRKLTSKQLYVSDVGDAGNVNQAKTTIIDASGGKKPATRAGLVKIFGNSVTTQNPYANLYEADFIVVVGRDQAASAASVSQ